MARWPGVEPIAGGGRPRVSGEVEMYAPRAVLPRGESVGAPAPASSLCALVVALYAASSDDARTTPPQRPQRARAARGVDQPRLVHRKSATLGGQMSAFGCYYLTRNRPYLIWKHGSALRFAAFSAYFLGTRVARMVLWAKAGRWDLVRATLAGLRDFGRRRMGARRGT